MDFLCKYLCTLYIRFKAVMPEQEGGKGATAPPPPYLADQLRGRSKITLILAFFHHLPPCVDILYGMNYERW